MSIQEQFAFMDMGVQTPLERETLNVVISLAKHTVKLVVNLNVLSAIMRAHAPGAFW